MFQNFHVRKLPTWLTDHGTLLTAPFVLCLILCALSSLAPICLVRILRTLSILDTLICFAILRKKETRQG